MKHKFSTQTFAKWILVGEHSVLRGCPALAFPLLSRVLRLDYTPSDRGLEVEFAGENGADLKLLFYGVIENAMHQLNIREPLSGHFVLNSNVPVGSGLGASATLCGAVARWCAAQGWIGDDIYEFARRLEDLFHGESSGVDLAVSLSGRGVHFERGKPSRNLTLRWWPHLYLSFSGMRGLTSECVAQVKRVIERNPPYGQQLDQQMREAVTLAERALVECDEKVGEPLLEQAINLANGCFNTWGLSHGDLAYHLNWLRESGAVAVKPTGSGGGGYVLSLWPAEPPVALLPRLLKIPPPQL